jgi:RNA polymerase sigma-70 factor (ECF subfamily)
MPFPAVLPLPPSHSLSLPDPPCVSDAELLSRLRSGETSAFDEVFRTWYEPLVRYVMRIVRDDAVAEDLAQDAMLELWRRRDQLAPDGGIQPYLWQSVRNRALNHLRHGKVRERAEPRIIAVAPVPAAADAEAGVSELTTALHAALDKLPPRCREVFELSRTRDLRYSEIAELLGVSVKAVEAQMGKALRVLREELSDWL